MSPRRRHPCRSLNRWMVLIGRRPSVVIGWLAVMSIALLNATPAAADNCSVFTDCFGASSSAANATLGLALLTGLSLLLDFTPIVGDVKGIVEAITGKDLLTGQELEPWERALGLLPLVPGVMLLRYADELGGLGRHLDDVEDVGLVGSVVRGGPPNPRPSAGTTYPLDPGSLRLVDEYRRPTTTSARRGGISEELGERGGSSYLRDMSRDPDLQLFRPQSDADVAGLVEDFAAGRAWPHAVTFRGAHATNIVYFDGDTLHIVEAKGGSSPYAVRNPTDPAVPGLSQTDPDYPRVVGSEMAESSLDDGRNSIGRIIGDAYEDYKVRYVGIRTGPAAVFRAGGGATTVDRVFLEALAGS